MKKFILLLIVALGISFASQAATRYLVTVTIKVNYVYYDESGVLIGQDSGQGTPQSIYVMAETPYEAEQKALSECSTMCQSSAAFAKDEGYRKYNGKLYKCKSYKEVYNASAEVAR